MTSSEERNLKQQDIYDLLRKIDGFAVAGDWSNARYHVEWLDNILEALQAEDELHAIRRERSFVRA